MVRFVVVSIGAAGIAMAYLRWGRHAVGTSRDELLAALGSLEGHVVHVQLGGTGAVLVGGVEGQLDISTVPEGYVVVRTPKRPVVVPLGRIRWLSDKARPGGRSDRGPAGRRTPPGIAGAE